MNLIGRAKHHLLRGSFSPIVASCSLKSIGTTRYYAEPATSEEVKRDEERLPADSDSKELRSPSSERVLRLVDEISELTVAESAELGIILMGKKGFKMKSGASRVAGRAAKDEREHEKSAFGFKIESFDEKTATKLK